MIFLQSDGFINGFIVGQAVMILLIMVLIRFLFFTSPSKYILIKPVRKRSIQTKEVSSVSTSLDEVLSKLGIDHKAEVNESCGWLNLLLSRLLFTQIHEDPTILERCTEILEETVSGATEYIVPY